MKNTNRTKILTILVLAIAVIAMSLGFAAFSTTLNISSSATVTPNSEDFKIKIYGIKDQASLDEFAENNYVFDEKYVSDTSGWASIENNSSLDDISAETAVVDNNTHTISGIKGIFGNSVGRVLYPIIVRNEGKYDAYVDLTNVMDDSVVYGLYDATCVAEEGATESLVNAACDGLKMSFTIIDKETGDVKTLNDSVYKIPVNSDELFLIMIDYEGPFPDGNFEASFPNIELEFSTAK